MFSRRREEGISLMEVLLSLTIISMMGLVWTGAFTKCIDKFNLARLETKASFIGQKIMEECLHGESKWESEKGYEDGFLYCLDIKETPEENLFLVEVRIYSNEEKEIICLRSYQFRGEETDNG